MDTQLEIVNRDIVAVGKQIVDEKAELKDAPEADKADIRKSLERLESRLDALIAHRRDLSVALAAALAPVDPRGRYPPLAVDASFPPLYTNTPNPPLVVAPLSSETPIFKPSFKSRFKPCVELEAAWSYGACPPVVRGGLCCTLVRRVRSVRYAVDAPSLCVLV
jgi:hypothetical protein